MERRFEAEDKLATSLPSDTNRRVPTASSRTESEPEGGLSETIKITAGDAGNRTPCLSHAKRALYHMSYVPLMRDEILNPNYLFISFRHTAFHLTACAAFPRQVYPHSIVTVPC